MAPCLWTTSYPNASPITRMGIPRPTAFSFPGSVFNCLEQPALGSLARWKSKPHRMFPKLLTSPTTFTLRIKSSAWRGPFARRSTFLLRIKLRTPTCMSLFGQVMNVQTLLANPLFPPLPCSRIWCCTCSKLAAFPISQSPKSRAFLLQLRFTWLDVHYE